jgi:hypothetical protein
MARRASGANALPIVTVALAMTVVVAVPDMPVLGISALAISAAMPLVVSAMLPAAMAFKAVSRPVMSLHHRGPPR